MALVTRARSLSGRTADQKRSLLNRRICFTPPLRWYPRDTCQLQYWDLRLSTIAHYCSGSSRILLGSVSIRYHVLFGIMSPRFSRERLFL